MAQNSKIGMKFFAESLPYFPEAPEFADQGMCPGGLGRNRDFYSKFVSYKKQPPQYIIDLLYDPQTSGGLLISLAEPDAARLAGTYQIGRVVERGEKPIRLI